MGGKLLASLLAACLCSVARSEVFSLSNLDWTLKNANGSIAIPASIPSHAHLDLLRAGIITEPLLGINGEFICFCLFAFEYPWVKQWIRKTHSDFGWDWGPAFVPSGVHKPAYLVTLSEANLQSATAPASHPLLVSSHGPLFIEESSLEVSKVGQTPIARPDESADWVVNVTLALRSAIALDSPTISISIPELQYTSEPATILSVPATIDAPTFVSATFTVPNLLPERWYPHNLGTPKLYNITTTVHVGSNSSFSFDTRTGFRTIVLVQSPYSQEEVDSRGITPGDQWHFEVNGKAFYSSGTNIIPPDPFYPRITSDKMRWIIESAVLSGQNMLRVWGGGTYQPSDELTGGYEFYSVCDELGILAWSELIFSDALYALNDFLIDSIVPEVRQNVRRINKHPSNAQWAGGNEIEVLVSLLDQIWPTNATHYMDEFITLFQDILHDVVSSETSSVAYTDCSTTNGALSLEPYILRLGNLTEGFIYGNTERYNYDPTQAFNYSTYPTSRFVNEFGFISQPSFYSWEEVLLSPDDFSFNSTVVMSRDHHPPAGGLDFPNPNAPQGQGQMTTAVELWLPTPETPDANQTFAQWCWSTQIFQSMNMASEIAWYRRGAGRGENNLGSLVWQLNDIWQGTSWSAIEHSGRWKVLQYGMTGAYSPVVIYPFWTPDNETLEVVVTSDRWETVKGTAQLTWYDWHGTVLETSQHPFTVPTLNNTEIFTASGLQNILPHNQSAENVFLMMNLTAQVEGKTITHEQVFTSAPLSEASLVDPEIAVTHTEGLIFEISARGGVGAWTWLDHPAGTVGYFAEPATGKPLNGFYLIPGITRTSTSSISTS
ncbi:hypothetical protein EIP86_011404 [Pleurotus ostreatoroseus]|nr:hypothetical protein EIP86_011404 [Pleurotus ostreatoroseus]